MISHNHKCIFVHIPKCGGQSIEHIFLDALGLSWNNRSPLLLRANSNPQVGPPRLAHLTYKDYIRYCYLSRALWEEYLSFSVVRNPYSRVASSYKYLGYQDAVCFETFVCKWLPMLSRGGSAWFLMPQLDYLVDEAGNIAVNRVIKLEQLDEELPTLLESVGISLSSPPPHVNKSSAAHGGTAILNRIRMMRQGVFEPTIRVDNSIKWTRESRAIVNSLYSVDFKAFNYDPTR